MKVNKTRVNFIREKDTSLNRLVQPFSTMVAKKIRLLKKNRLISLHAFAPSTMNRGLEFTVIKRRYLYTPFGETF